MMMKTERAVSVLLCITMLLSLAACSGSKGDDTATTAADGQSAPGVQTVYAKKATAARKNETVYVNLDSSGKLLFTTVTDWIHTPEAQVYVDDVSDLEGITNLKSNTSPVKTEQGLRWYMDSTDLYYSGTTKRTPPVDFTITYYLDGKKIAPADIAGKSGRVRVETSMKNNVKTKAMLGGKHVQMYLPVAVVGVAVLDEARFSGVTVENGLAVGDASKEIAVNVCFPGMRESLGLDEMKLTSFAGYSIADTCAFNAQAVDFEIGNMYYVVIPLCALNTGMAMPDSVQDIKKDIDLLTKIINAVSAVDFTSVMDALAANPNSVKSLESMVTTAASLYTSNRELLRVLSKYLTDENVAALSKLLADADDAQVLEAIKLLQNPILQAFIKGLPELMDDLNVLLPSLEAMQKDMQTPEIQASLDKMPQTLDSLAELLKGLDENRALVEALSKVLSEGKASAIDEILQELTKTDFEGSAEKYDGVIEHSDELLVNIKAWVEAGSGYKVFTKAAQDMQTNLMFIYQTRSVKYTAPAAPAAEEVAEPWYKKLFSR